MDYVTDKPDLMQIGAMYRTVSSDREIAFTKDAALSSARDVARTSPYGRSAIRVKSENVIGAEYRLSLTVDTRRFGVSPEEAEDWIDVVKAEWRAYAESTHFSADAQRKQTFSGLARTSFISYFVSGEALASVEWKSSFTNYKTCMNLIDPERLSDPKGIIDRLTNRRMGVERDMHGAPLAYHIRHYHISDGSLWNIDTMQWDRYERYTKWGRPRILHAFEHDRVAMTRGISHFITAVDPLRQLDKFQETELESAGIRAAFAAVIESELDYDKAMELLSPDQKQLVREGGYMEMVSGYMKNKLGYYSNQNIRVGNSKVVHLIPNEKLDLKTGQTQPGQLKEFDDVSLYKIASALGVDTMSLKKDYSTASYSGGRAAEAEIARSYAVTRRDFNTQFVIPFFYAWLEEAIVVKGSIPMLGEGSFYENQHFLRVDFEAPGKIKLDPAKETAAQVEAYHIGARSLKDICDEDSRDWREVLQQRAREKQEMEDLRLTPADIDPTLLGQGQGEQPQETGSEDK